MYWLLDLLFVKFGSLSVSCLSQADITYAIDSTVCLKKKTSPTFLAVTRESIVGFS